MQQGMFQQRQTLVHTARLKRLRREKEVAFRSGDRDRFKALKYSFNKAVRDAKQQNTVKLQQQFTASDSVSVWGGGFSQIYQYHHQRLTPTCQLPKLL